MDLIPYRLFSIERWIVNFPDKHCICVHKCKTRHNSVGICRVSENCPLERSSNAVCFFLFFVGFMPTLPNEVVGVSALAHLRASWRRLLAKQACEGAKRLCRWVQDDEILRNFCRFLPQRPPTPPMLRIFPLASPRREE